MAKAKGTTQKKEAVQLATVEVIQEYFDLQEKKLMNVGDKLKCNDERAEYLAKRKFVSIVKKADKGDGDGVE